MRLAFWPGGGGKGGAAAATAAAASPPRALVLVDGGHFGGPDFPADSIDAYLAYDAEETLSRLDRATRVLMVVAGRNQVSVDVVARFERLVPWADVRIVDSGHDVIEEMPDELGTLIAEWLHA